ncbi:MAG: hypothetical protein M1834_008352 [Cirrosporium novae-zelandiae]|nr:MAG: hypothetical protein M1834_008352 [Cirrosporium novae-zelandiae]
MEQTTSTTDPIPDPMIRPNKRRKFMRRRFDDDDETTTETHPSPPQHSISHGNNDEETKSNSADEDLAISEILRLRKAVKSRRGGIEFSNNPSRSTSTDPNSSTSMELVQQGAVQDPVQTAADRFIPHTGLVANVDKHMMEYIDTEMARRLKTDAPGHSSSTKLQTGSNNPVSSTDPISTLPVHTPLQRQPASLGKLHEIDLGPDATLRNIARTEAAARGEPLPDEENGRGKKVRLGRDGKPWRGRRRRNSEELARDRLVEEVLRESRLDLYDPTTVTPLLTTTNPDESEAADDRIAEQFRREFMDAIQSRRQRAPRPSANSARGTGGKPEPPRGPKLGGSRSARAAMRERELAASGKK